jgi:hypothetical protein
VVQLHKRFTDERVRELIEKYMRKEITRNYLQEILGIGKKRLFALIKEHRHDSSAFSIRYVREKKTRAISKDVEKNILQELARIKTHIAICFLAFTLAKQAVYSIALQQARTYKLRTDP